MSRIIKFLFWILLIWLSCWPSAQENARPLSLDECITMALEKNLSLQVQVLAPEWARYGVRQAWGEFLPSLAFDYDKQNLISPSFSWTDAEGDVITRYSEYQGRLEQLSPIGTKVSISLGSYRNDTNRRLQTINPRYGSQFQLSLTQPLLKGFGLAVNRKEILVAKNNRSIADNDLKAAIMDTVYAVEEAYWNWVYALENLKGLQYALQLARELMERTEKQVNVKMMAPIDITTALAEVALREADILQAETDVKNSEDRLRTLINFDQAGGLPPGLIFPADGAVARVREVDLAAEEDKTRTMRPDLLSAALDLKNKNVELLYVRNQSLPDLSLQAAYWSPGISGTRIKYQNDDPLTGIVIGTLPGTGAEAMRDALGFKYPNWLIGFSLRLPLGQVFSRAAAAQGLITCRQSLLSFRAKEQQALLEVRSAVRQVQTNAKRVTGYAAALKLAQTKLEAEQKRLEVGMTTNYQVLQYQRDLANARSAELKARIDYLLSEARLQRATGNTMAERRIRLFETGKVGLSP